MAGLRPLAAALVLLSPGCSAAAVGGLARDVRQMNQDVRYLISNAPPGQEDKPRGFVGSWFEVYSPPIRSRYSQVFWRTMDAVRLPEWVVARYNGSKAMAVTGFEVDVVRRTDGGAKEVSVPCTESYNHHYNAYIMGSDAEILGAGEDMGHGPMLRFGLRPGAANLVKGVPITQAFNEHNGNEHRQSYHGYPRGVVQPIARPERFVFNPMQINTRNPDRSGRVGGPLPRNSRAPPNASYSGLLECPCTTRTKKTPRTAGRPGTIDGQPYTPDCKPRPLSDLLAEHNPTCEAETYVGGMACCTDGTFLLDADQDIPPLEDEVFFKWRFYFEDYNPVAHRGAFHIEWALNGCDSGGPPHNPKNCRHIEYDVPQAPRGTAPEAAVHQITSTWRVRDMMYPCDSRKDFYCADPGPAAKAGVLPIMIGGHCHAPACISLELRNADTGELLCEIRPTFGHGTQARDEKDYLWLPPCQFGRPNDGLRPPPVLHLDTNLTSTKRANSTYFHPGVMAIWQMRAIYAAEGLPGALADGAFV